MFASVEEVDLDRRLEAIVGIAETGFDLGAFIGMKQINHPLDPEEGVGERVHSKPKSLHGAGLEVFVGIVEIMRRHHCQPTDHLGGEFLGESDSGLVEGLPLRHGGPLLMRPIQLCDPGELSPARRSQ